MKNNKPKAVVDAKQQAEKERVLKIQGSHGYKSKVKKSVEQIKRYLLQAHGRKITKADVKSVKYLLVPIEKERREYNNA